MTEQKAGFRDRLKKLVRSLHKRKARARLMLSKGRSLIHFLWKGQLKPKAITYKRILPVACPDFRQEDRTMGICRNVHVFLYRYMVADKNNFFLYRKLARTPKSFSLHLPRRSRWELEISGDILGVLSLPLTNFYHTVKDIYFQIFIAAKKGIQFPFLFMGQMEKFHVDLKKILFPNIPFLQNLNDEIPVFCRALRVIHPASWDIYDSRAHPSTFEFWEEYKEKIIHETGKAAVAPSGGWPENIYLSRQRSSRRFQNGQAVEHLLRGRGFTPIFLEDHSLATQIQFAVHSKRVVGSHGANLTHLFFCSPKTSVVEVASKEFANNDCYEKIQNINSLRYRKITGSACKNDEFLVDLQKLRAALT